MSDDKAVPNVALPVIEVVTQEEMIEWEACVKQLDTLKVRELQLRTKIFGSFFPNPVEGTNNVELENSYVLKAQYKLNRTPDEALLTQMAEQFKAAKLPVKDLIKHKPELVTSAYRALPADQRALFDKALIIKVGTPQLEIVQAKRSVRKTPQ
jgi:hypothetical protein